MSLPLISEEVVAGVLNVYAHAPGSFDERSEELGEVFAVPAALAVQNAQILAQRRRLAVSLQAALTDQARPDFYHFGQVKITGGL